MAWSAPVGSKSWTGGTRVYSSLSQALSATPSNYKKTPSVGSVSTGGSSSSKSGGGGGAASSSTTPSKTTSSSSSSLSQAKAQSLAAASFQASRAQQALKSGNYSLYLRSMNAYNRAMKDYAATPTPKTGGGGSAPSSAKSLTIVDREGTPVTRYTVTEQTMNLSSRADLAKYGVQKPGVYQVRSLTQENIPRTNYYGFGTGVKVPIERPFSPSPSPVLTVAIENAFGLGPRLVSSSTQTKPASWLFGKDQSVRTDVYESRSGAQSQLFMLASGKSASEAMSAGFAPARLTVLTPSSQPSETWRYARETKGWRVLTDTLQRSGWAISDYGAGLANRASDRWIAAGRPTTGLATFGNRLQYDVGAGVRFGGEWLGGLGTGIREEPGRVAVAVGVGVATGATGKLLGTWASFGGTGAGLTNFGFKGAMAFAGGYYGASEVDAIRRSANPGARAALTTLDVAGFVGGAKLGSFLVPNPVVTGVRVSSTKGLLAETGGSLQGQIVRKGSVYTSWLGKTRKVGFLATEQYAGSEFAGRVKYANGVTSSYGGSLVRIVPEAYSPTLMRQPAGSQTILFKPKGTEFTTLTRSGLTGYDVRGRTLGFGEKNMVFLGSSDKGKGFVDVFMRGPAPTRGFLTYATGEAATVFQPGSFSGVGVFPGSGTVALPGIESFAPALPAVPSFGALARGFSVPQTYGFLGLPSVESRAKSVFSAESMAISPVLASASPLTTSFAFPVADVTSGSTSEPVVETVPDTLAITGTDTRSVVGIDYTGGGFGEPFVPPPVEPPLFPFDLGPPAIGFGYGRRSFGGRGGTNFRTRYNPSLIGVDFRIRGSRASANAAALTGIAVRPIV